MLLSSSCPAAPTPPPVLLPRQVRKKKEAGEQLDPWAPEYGSDTWFKTQQDLASGARNKVGVGGPGVGGCRAAAAVAAAHWAGASWWRADGKQPRPACRPRRAGYRPACSAGMEAQSQREAGSPPHKPAQVALQLFRVWGWGHLLTSQTRISARQRIASQVHDAFKQQKCESDQTY